MANVSSSVTRHPLSSLYIKDTSSNSDSNSYSKSDSKSESKSNSKFTSVSSPPRYRSQSAEVYEVSGIIASRRFRKRQPPKYRVRWAGMDPQSGRAWAPTWQPFEDLDGCQEEVLRFHLDNPKSVMHPKIFHQVKEMRMRGEVSPREDDERLETLES